MKGGGQDHVINEFFKYGFNYVAVYLVPLFNKLYDIGHFPSQWTEGYIVLIFKKRDEILPENYRGITLLSTLGKLFTRVSSNRFSDWAENYFEYTEAQAGFRPKMGTIVNLFVLHGAINQIINSGKNIICLFRGLYKSVRFISQRKHYFFINLYNMV